MSKQLADILIRQIEIQISVNEACLIVAPDSYYEKEIQSLRERIELIKKEII